MRRHLRETETELVSDDDDGAERPKSTYVYDKLFDRGADCVLFPMVIPMALLLPQLGPSEKVPQRRQKPIWWQLLW
jgi:hypothetical protein